MKIEINKMKMLNFMGIKELELIFNGKNAVISGENGSGKTTIKTAFSWVLFDKNTFGDTKFGIKPVDEQGNTIHNLETSVEIELNIDEAVTTLKRVMTEKWTRKRGDINATFSGNENSYFINGVPKKKAEYKAFVSTLISEDVFKTITDPLYFNEQIDWQARRNFLIDICGNISDDEIIDNDPELSPLKKELSTATVEDFMTLCKNSLKLINKNLGDIPIRIAEAEKAIPVLDDTEVNLAEAERLEKISEELRAKKSEYINGAELVRLKAEKTELEKQTAFVPFNNADSPLCKQLASSDELLKQANFDFNCYQEEAQMSDSRINTIEAEIEKHKEDLDEVYATRFIDENCPLCGQELPLEKLEDNRKMFNVHKAETIETLEEKIIVLDKELETHKKNRSLNIKLLNRTSARIEELKEEKEAIEKELEEVKGIYEQKERERIEAFTRQIEMIDSKIHNYNDEVSSKVKYIDDELEKVAEHTNHIREKIALKEMTEKQKRRIKDLQEEQANLSTEYMSFERRLYLCELFFKKKVQLLNDKINEKFNLAKFKLFDMQVNGGLVETCETTYLGIPYKDMNNAARVNVGLDIINVLCSHYGTTAPIFLDNMESVNEPLKTASQQIRLYVSKDKELRVEIGD